MIGRVILVSLAVACISAQASAHAFLEHAQPGAAATLRASPPHVALTFTEELEPVFSGLTVTDSAGRSVEGGPVIIRGKAIVVPLRPLPPGKYRAVWHAVSVDTHRTEGAYSFAVKP